MYIADLHIHSKYSRATSRDCDLAHLDAGARLKGIQLLGTGDFTHPAWRSEMRSALEDMGDGTYTLREELRLRSPFSEQAAPRFIISGEISTIYKKDGKTRKVHHLILLPSLDAADELSRRLELVGNIRSDGRPILGLDSRELMELTFDSCPDAIFIPAHIWTPHFSLFGAFSEFSTLEECYGDMSRHIFALETGLSSDPPMNRQLSMLDKYHLVSNSDAHSPAKLGREANILDCELSYAGLKHALETGDGLTGTIEFFPEEGKYHLDGHRACKCRLEPAETRSLSGRCPVCGRKVTVGVQHRVDQLSDRSLGAHDGGRFEYLMPLQELLADSMGATTASKKVQAAYDAAISSLGPELYILRECPIERIENTCGTLAAEAMRRLRSGNVIREAGYDGEYGVISLFHPGERQQFMGQTSFIDISIPIKKTSRKTTAAPEVQQIVPETSNQTDNPEQLEAISAPERAVAVIAGPGTGKTYTLVARVEYMISHMGVKPAEITAVTFTNQAADELRQRLAAKLGKRAARSLNIGTFHSVCLSLSPEKPIAGHPQALAIMAGITARRGDAVRPAEALRRISARRNGAPADPLPEGLEAEYREALADTGMRDLDDILEEALTVDVSGLPAFRNLLVDEYQDVNAVQRALVAHWLTAGGSLFVIGDPDQSIYGFRGASAGCFDELGALLPGLRTITLTRNYRSAPGIISAALQVISANPGESRMLHPVRPGAVPPRCICAPDPVSEAHMIAREISRMTGGIDMTAASGMETALAFSDIAVICRTRRRLAHIENVLLQEGIPCAVIGRDEEPPSEDVLDALAFLRLLAAGKPTVGHRWHAFGEMFAPRIAKDRPAKLIADLSKVTGCNMQALKDAALFFERVPAMLDAIETGGEGDIKRLCGGKYASGAVTLMTIHGSKGLEFPAVFLAGVTEGEFPSERADIREERRLCFVGITRARDELIISSGGRPSRFMDELPPDIPRENAAAHREKTVYEQLSFL